MGDLYIVHCVDTEGPLYESIEATFQRLKEIFGIEIDATESNLKLIQHCKLDLGGIEELVADAFAPSRINTLGTWTELDNVLESLMSNKFRFRIPDSDGNGWIFNWFCLNHVGFQGNNPRRRDAGYGNIYKHYLSMLKRNNCTEKDLIQFHYHALPFNSHYNYAGTAYVNSDNIFNILAHHIIDDEIFPAAYRAGMEAERPDSHWFLEQWIPFDYSNASFEKKNEARQPDLRNGRYGDWRHASREWRPYHPSHDDYQLEGNCHRLITRCISLDSRVAKVEKYDVEDAFKLASEEGKAVLSFANHDFRDMHDEVNRVMDLIHEVSADFQNVSFHYSNAIEAMWPFNGIAAKEINFATYLNCDIEKNIAELHVTAEGNIFGSQPFLAIKTKAGQYYWDNFDYGNSNGEWFYVFDDKTINLNALSVIAFASNRADGYTEIVKIDLDSGVKEKIVKFGHRQVSRVKF